MQTCCREYKINIKKEPNLVGRGIDHNHLRLDPVLCNKLIVIVLQLLVEIQQILGIVTDCGRSPEAGNGV